MGSFSYSSVTVIASLVFSVADFEMWAYLISFFYCISNHSQFFSCFTHILNAFSLSSFCGMAIFDRQGSEVSQYRSSYLSVCRFLCLCLFFLLDILVLGGDAWYGHFCCCEALVDEKRCDDQNAVERRDCHTEQRVETLRNRRINFLDKKFFPVSSGVSEWASERANGPVLGASCHSHSTQCVAAMTVSSVSTAWLSMYSMCSSFWLKCWSLVGRLWRLTLVKDDIGWIKKGIQRHLQSLSNCLE